VSTEWHLGIFDPEPHSQALKLQVESWLDYVSNQFGNVVGFSMAASVSGKLCILVHTTDNVSKPPAYADDMWTRLVAGGCVKVTEAVE